MPLISFYYILIYLYMFTFPFLKNMLNVHMGLYENKDIKFIFCNVKK